MCFVTCIFSLSLKSQLSTNFSSFSFGHLLQDVKDEAAIFLQCLCGISEVGDAHFLTFVKDYITYQKKKIFSKKKKKLKKKISHVIVLLERYYHIPHFFCQLGSKKPTFVSLAKTLLHQTPYFNFIIPFFNISLLFYFIFSQLPQYYTKKSITTLKKSFFIPPIDEQ